MPEPPNGCEIPIVDGSWSFGHGGFNEGSESTITAYALDGEGAVVMTNAQRGSKLADEVMRSSSAAYHWPAFQSKVRAVVAVDPKIPASYEGHV